MGKKVLVVDDAKVVRDLISFILIKEGYSIVEAANGNEALKKLDDNKVDLVITDLNMPEMNGIDLIRSLRSTDAYRFLPIVMLTTVSQEQRKAEGMSAGASGWILKPFNSIQLLNTLQKVCQ